MINAFIEDIFICKLLFLTQINQFHKNIIGFSCAKHQSFPKFYKCHVTFEPRMFYCCKLQKSLKFFELFLKFKAIWSNKLIENHFHVPIYMWLVGCPNPYKMEQSREYIFLRLSTHIIPKLASKIIFIIGLQNY